jgi:hypothetical protein
LAARASAGGVEVVVSRCSKATDVTIEVWGAGGMKKCMDIHSQQVRPKWVDR